MGTSKWGRGTQPRPQSGVIFAPCGPTSPLAQAYRLARLAVIRLEAIARAALVPEDVGLVSEDHVAGDGVVGWRRPFEALGYDHPAREAGGSGWNVMDDVVVFDLHAPGPEQSNADSGDRRGLFSGRACTCVVLYVVSHHVKHTRRTRCIGEEQHPQAIVVDVVTSDLAVAGIAHEDAKQITVGFVTGHGRVRVGRVTHVDTGLIGSARKVGDYLRSSREAGENPVFPVVEGTISHELGVACSDRDDPRVPEVPHGEAAYGHVVCLNAKA